MLLDLVTELEALSEIELAWEEKQVPFNRDIYLENVRLRKQYSATSALHGYHNTVVGGFISRVDYDIVVHNRKRSHQPDSEVATDPVKQNESSSTITTPTPSENNVDGSQPKSKRRRMNTGVRFNDQVYVHTEADVDVLRDNAIRQKVSSPSNGAAAFTADNLRLHDILNTPFNTGAMPSRPDYVIPLKSHAGPSRSSKSGSSRRTSGRYKPGQWAVEEGREFADTSGAKTECLFYEIDMDMFGREAATNSEQIRDCTMR